MNRAFSDSLVWQNLAINLRGDESSVVLKVAPKENQDFADADPDGLSLFEPQLPDLDCKSKGQNHIAYILKPVAIENAGEPHLERGTPKTAVWPLGSSAPSNPT